MAEPEAAPVLVPPLDAQQIQAILPHRYPFLLVDRVLELEPGARVVGVKQVSMGDAFLQGHFPDNPIMPGVLIVEALAQTGAILALAEPANRGRVPYFARIDNCRFRRPVRPGDSLRLEVELQASRGPVGKAHARAAVDGAVVCEADLTFAFESAPRADGAVDAGPR
jgi:3-hydroxyacyl-[acyl-carrier-protein] dehydratase